MAGAGAEFYGDISFEGVIFHQLLRTSALSQRLFYLATSEWQANALNYYFSVKTLEAIVAPYLDEDYFKYVKELTNKAVEKYNELKKNEQTDLTKTSKYQYVLDTVNLSNDILKAITNKLKEAGLLIPPSAGITIGENEEWIDEGE